MKKALLLLGALVGLFNQVSTLSAQGAKYLIVTPDNFYNAVLPLAKWKHKKGVETKVVKLSESGSTVSQIKSYIQNAYNTWNPRPQYVLLVGDIEFLPSYYSWDSGIYTDNHYAQLAGGDILADVCIGRFSVDTPRECSTMVAKTLGYERTPWTADVNWFKSAALIVRNDWDQDDNIYYYPDAQFAYNILSQNGFTNIDTLYERNGAHAGNVISSVNNGCLFVGYRGSSGMNWSYPFNVNPALLNNEWKLPIVVSATCLTGSFQEDGADCERWTRAGTPQEPKGAVAYLSTNTGRSNSAHIRSSLCRNFWRALFTDNIFVLGDVFVRQKLRFWNELSDTKDYRGWHLFGDPELNIWTDIPGNMVAAHPVVVPVGSGNFTVSVKKQNNSPIQDALVCILKTGEIYKYGLTDMSGEITFTVSPATTDTMWVTVTAHNYIPYEGYAIVIPGGPYVALYKYSIIDTANNDDGIPNSGEHIWMPMWVKNYGGASAIFITGKLSTDDSFITFIDSIEFLGDIAALDSTETTVPYEFIIAPNCPGGHNIEFNLTCADTLGNSWLSSFSITVTTPTIEISGRTVDDAGQSTPNGFIDPGEAIKLIIKLLNSGNASAHGVTVVLRSNDVYTTITDSSFYYGDIGSGSVVDNSLDPFDINCSSSTPLYHKIPFSLYISSQDGYEATLNFILKVGAGGDYLVWDPDINRTSGVIIDSLLMLNGYKGDYTMNVNDFLPFLSEYKVIFLCLGVYPNHYTLYIPENKNIVDSLIQFLADGGKMYIEGGESWSIHPNYSGNRIHPYFHVYQDDDGYADVDTILGVANTFTSGMKFKYLGENYSMDRLRAGSGAWSIFENLTPQYANGIAFTYGVLGNWRKTILTTFELAGLSDDIIPKATLVDSTMKWFLREAHHDISVWRIGTPKYFFVTAGNSVNPTVKIRNIGEYNENSIKVICNIDSASYIIYNDTVTTNANSGDTVEVVFDQWTAGEVGQNYKFTFKTGLAGDEENQNNIVSKEVSVFKFSTCINSQYTAVVPVMDGIIDTSYEWLNATRVDISNLYGTGQGSSPQPPGVSYLYVMNNDTCIFWGIDVRKDCALNDGDKFVFWFDDNHNHYYPTNPSSYWEGYLWFYYQPPAGEFHYRNLLYEGQEGSYLATVNLAHAEGVGSGNLQYEFALPMNWAVPEYINAAPGDTIGFSILTGYYNRVLNSSYYYGRWTQGADTIYSPTQLGDLVIAQYGAEIVDNLPKVYKISQNIPNPAFYRTDIFYQLPMKSKVSLKIYNTAGQLVRTLVDATEQAGYKSVGWDGKDNMEKYVSSGVYWYRFEAKSVKENKIFMNTKKIVFFGK